MPDPLQQPLKGTERIVQEIIILQKHLEEFLGKSQSQNNWLFDKTNQAALNMAAEAKALKDSCNALNSYVKAKVTAAKVEAKLMEEDD